MKTIKIFIGSSILDLELERAKLMSFIQGLNNKYHERGVFIEGYICEETPNDMHIGGSQARHNDYIRCDADMTIFMFFHKAGEFTLQELQLAREAFLRNGRPNVYVFFKAVDKTPDTSEEIQRAIRLVFEDYGHYYKVFEDVDTVKLELLQFLADLLPGKAELVVKDGAVYVNGEAVRDISSANVFAYQNNPDLARLKKQIDRFRAMEAAAAERGDESAALRLSASRNAVQKEYHELEMSILDMLRYFHEQNKKGAKADPLLNEALRQLELGEIELVKAMIPQEELDRMAEAFSRRRQLAEAQLREEAETLLSRTRVRIKALRMDQSNPNRFDEMEHTYRNAYEAAKAAGDHALIYDYANFLYDQNRFPEAIGIAERLKHRYDDPDQKNEVSEDDRARLLNLTGMLYASVHHPDPAEQAYREALAIYRRLAESVSRDAYAPYVAGTCNNLAAFCVEHGKPEEAEQAYREALEICRRLAETVSRGAYARDGAAT